MAETNGGGRTLAEMAGDEDLDLGAEGRPEYLEGSRGQLSWNVGGLEPASAEVTLTGAKFRVAGEFRKGELVDLRLRARVFSVSFDDEDDPDGFPETCVRRMKAKVVSYERVEGPGSD